jgi:phenylalanyl-tRNA synthetase beta chain
VQTLPAGTKFTTLDDIERTLHEEDLMICDEKDLCALLVFLVEKIRSFRKYQCYIFKAPTLTVSIRKTAKRHQLNTDAFRFERRN